MTFVDYLYVDYSKSFLGLRKKRRKYPKIDNKDIYKRGNVLKINQPLASLHFWNLIENSSVYVEEHNYRNEVPNPDEITVHLPEDFKQYYVKIPDNIPSLYRISSKTFPIKWKERKCGTSVEDLMKIEEEDFIEQWSSS